jgi:hypothetical protein
MKWRLRGNKQTRLTETIVPVALRQACTKRRKIFSRQEVGSVEKATGVHFTAGCALRHHLF